MTISKYFAMRIPAKTQKPTSGELAEPEAVYDTEVEVDDGIDTDTELSEAWKIEIKRRIDDVRSGRVKMIDGKKVMEEACRILAK